MTQQQAAEAVNDILNALGDLGLLPPPGQPFTLQGGQLNAEPHPELSTHWRPMWHPIDDTLMPLDLEGFPVKVAAEQISRYRHNTYLTIRHKLEQIFADLVGEEIYPIESRTAPDSFLVSKVGLDIIERTGSREMSYAIVLTTNPIPVELRPGEAAPESREIDITDADPSNVLQLLRNGE